MARLAAVLAALLVVAAGCAEGAEPRSDAGPSGIRGRVVAGPTCPVETADARCPDLPTSVRLLVLSGEDEVASVRSDADGRFRVAVPPGTYRLVADLPGAGGPPAARPVTVTVPEGRFVRVTVHVDTGIR